MLSLDEPLATFIDGERRAPSSGRRLDVEDPATGGTIAASEKADVDTATGPPDRPSKAGPGRASIRATAGVAAETERIRVLPPLDQGCQLGSLIESGIDAGARLITGGHRVTGTASTRAISTRLLSLPTCDPIENYMEWTPVAWATAPFNDWYGS